MDIIFFAAETPGRKGNAKYMILFATLSVLGAFCGYVFLAAQV